MAEVTSYQCPNCQEPLAQGEFCPDCQRMAVPALPAAATAIVDSAIVDSQGQPVASAVEPLPAPEPAEPRESLEDPISRDTDTSDETGSNSWEADSGASNVLADPDRFRQKTTDAEQTVAEQEPREPSGAVRAARSRSSAARPLSPPAEVLKAGERELREHIADGYRFLLVAGVPSTGKTELLSSYERYRAKHREGTYLDRFARHEGKVLTTVEGTLDCYPIPGTRQMFVDASGEDFKNLYPRLRKSGRLEEADAGFLRTLVSHLDGVLLLLDLRRLWYPEGDEQQKKEQMKQVEILTWILMLLRWLEHDGKYPQSSSQSFVDYVNRQVQAFRGRRLTAPVTLLFSRADEAFKLEVPIDDLGWLTGTERERRLFPPGEAPFFLAFHCLEKLYGALRSHTRSFRIDFVHSFRADKGTGAVIDKNPMGLFPAVEWMLRPRWQRKLTLPTRHLIAMQQWIDRLWGRSARWERLPDPVRVKP